MRRLLLIRHADTEHGEVDRARELTDQGRRDARRIGEWLVANDCLPDLVAVSSAVRAQQTWEIAAAELPAAPPVAVLPPLYDNTVEAVLTVVRSMIPSVHTLAVVGHNPSIEHLVVQWSAAGANDDAGELVGGVPTGSIAMFELSEPWENLSSAGLRLARFTTCRG